jgi:hypothetical protein
MKNEKNKAEKQYNILTFCYSNYLEVVNFTVYFACLDLKNGLKLAKYQLISSF